MNSTEKLKNLVVGAVKLAIVRHDLATDDMPTFDEDAADTIASDVWEALNGVGTCDDAVMPELAAVLDLLWTEPIPHTFSPFTTRDGDQACSECYAPKEHRCHV